MIIVIIGGKKTTIENHIINAQFHAVFPYPPTTTTKRHCARPPSGGGSHFFFHFVLNHRIGPKQITIVVVCVCQMRVGSSGPCDAETSFDPFVFFFAIVSNNILTAIVFVCKQMQCTKYIL